MKNREDVISEVVDMTGKLICTMNQIAYPGNNKINLKLEELNLPQGLYFVRITFSGGTINKKLIYN